jgi:GT2 family glycosyltransferase
MASSAQFRSSLITVAIPTYNGERYIAETIASVRRQSHQALEIIVVDDGSTDVTRDLPAHQHARQLLLPRRACTAMAQA